MGAADAADEDPVAGSDGAAGPQADIDELVVVAAKAGGADWVDWLQEAEPAFWIMTAPVDATIRGDLAHPDDSGAWGADVGVGIDDETVWDAL